MLARSNALEYLKNLTTKFKVDTIEFYSIHGKIGSYSYIFDRVIDKNNYYKIIYGKHIFNNRYKLGKIPEINGCGAIWIKLIRKNIKYKIIRYLEKLDLNNLKNWNYGEDQYLHDLIRLFSETYLHVNTVLHFYYKNPNSFTLNLNNREFFVDHIKYLHYFNKIVKEFKINKGFLICNIVLILIKRHYKKTEVDCVLFSKLIKEINGTANNLSNYWNRKYKSLIKKYNKLCSQVKIPFYHKF